jgi:hypothetical protein
MYRRNKDEVEGLQAKRKQVRQEAAAAAAAGLPRQDLCSLYHLAADRSIGKADVCLCRCVAA